MWFTNNQNVVQIMMVGSKEPHMQTITLNAFSVCVVNQIRLEPEWLLREENIQVDLISSGVCRAVGSPYHWLVS